MARGGEGTFQQQKAIRLAILCLLLLRSAEAIGQQDYNAYKGAYTSYLGVASSGPQRKGDPVVVTVTHNPAQGVLIVADLNGNTFKQTAPPIGNPATEVWVATKINPCAWRNVTSVYFSGPTFSPAMSVVEYQAIEQHGYNAYKGAYTSYLGVASSGPQRKGDPVVVTVTHNPAQGVLIVADLNGNTFKRTTSPIGNPATEVWTATKINPCAWRNVTSVYFGGPTFSPAMSVVEYATASPATTPSSTPTPVPTVPPTSIPTVTLAWDVNVPTGNKATDAAGYHLKLGFARGEENTVINVLGQQTSTWTVSLQSHTTYFFVVTAYNAAGVESIPSNEVSYTSPP